MFKQRPQSPEVRSEDPKVTRETKVALAVGFLTAAIEATHSREVFAVHSTPVEQEPTYTSPVYPTISSREALLDQARISTERAFNAHGEYSFPAESVTDDFIDAQNMLNRRETGATVIPLHQQFVENNPIIRKAA